MEGENGLNDNIFVVELLVEMDFWMLCNCFILKSVFELVILIMKNKWVLFYFFVRLDVMLIFY